MKVLRGELFFDLFWVVLAAGYVYASYGYPPAGRLVPLTFGVAALAIGVFQLVGNFFATLRPYTHGREGEGEPARAGARGMSQLKAVAWAVFLLFDLYAFGAVWGMLVFFIPYFGLRGKRWGLGILCGVIMMLVAWGFFGQLMGLQLPEAGLWAPPFP